MILIIALRAALWPNPLNWFTVPVKYRSVSGLWKAKAPDWPQKPRISPIGVKGVMMRGIHSFSNPIP